MVYVSNCCFKLVKASQGKRQKEKIVQKIATYMHCIRQFSPSLRKYINNVCRLCSCFIIAFAVCFIELIVLLL